jgi:HK97 family phage major capsid protein
MDFRDLNELRSIEELATYQKELQARKDELNQEFDGLPFTDDAREEYARCDVDEKEIDKRVTELRARLEDITRRAQRSEQLEQTTDVFQTTRPGVVKGDAIYDLSTVRRSWDDPSVEGSQLRDRALRAVEIAQFPHERANREDCQTHVERLVARIDDEQGTFSRYLIETGSPQYRRAFSKYLADGGVANTRTPAENQMLQRAASLTTTAGGFAVPFVLDPTVIPTGSGAINPYRAISNVKTQSVDEWRGVSSAGITAAFQAEAAAVTDAAPTLAQPTVSTEMARAFVPFSIEIGQDWGSFASEMASMIQDSKDVLEATKFAVGSGTNEPFGVITGATTVYTAAGTNALVVADVYGVHNALGPRFRAQAVWTFNNAVTDRIRQLDTAGGANLWVQNLQLRSAAVPNGFTDGRMGADLLGKPAYEASAQSGTFTTGQLIGVIGDYGRGYVIVDRIGLNIETIPHIFGAAQGNLPTGQRGLFAYWRVGAKVVDANMFRTLKLA